MERSARMFRTSRSADSSHNSAGILKAMLRRCGFLLSIPLLASAQNWTQWGSNPQHSGAVRVAGQLAAGSLADVALDPFVKLEQAENGGDLVVHYPSPLVDRQDVFLLLKTGNYVACGKGVSPCGS